MTGLRRAEPVRRCGRGGPGGGKFAQGSPELVEGRQADWRDMPTWLAAAETDWVAASSRRNTAIFGRLHSLWRSRLWRACPELVEGRVRGAAVGAGKSVIVRLGEVEGTGLFIGIGACRTAPAIGDIRLIEHDIRMLCSPFVKKLK